MMAPSGFCLAFAIVLAYNVLATQAKETVHLGVLLPVTLGGYPDLGRGLGHTVDIAIKNVYDRGWISRDYNLTFSLQDSACNALKAVGHIDDLHIAHAFIGPACSDACLSAALLAAHRNKPIISYSCSSTELKSASLYPTFLRTQPFTRTYSSITPVLLYRVMLHYNWSNAAIISPEDNIWASTALSLRLVLDKNNVTVPYFVQYASRKGLEHKTVLVDAMKVSRVIFLLAFSDDVAQFLLAAEELGMRNGEYAFITLDFDIQPNWKNAPWAKGLDEKKLFQIFNGIVNLSVKDAHGPLFAAFKENVLRTLQANNISMSSLILQFSVYLHDAIELYAVALNRTLKNGGNWTDGRLIVKNVINQGTLFTGVSGDVALNKDGNRIPVFVFSNRQNNTMVPVLQIDLSKNENERVILYNMTAIWPGGSTKVPLDEPKCGFKGEKCLELPTEAPREGTVLYVLYTVVPVVIIIALLFGLLYYRKQLYEKDLMSTSWIISYSDITLVNQESGRFSTGRVRSQAHSLISGIGEDDMASSDLGRYKGELVVIQRFSTEHVNLTREIRAEAKKVRDLQHSNLNQFVGFCNEPPNVCIVSPYCQRGTLQDLLGNDDINIDWMFRMSFANDIASGMVALHNSPVEAHGNLMSSTCLIDSRWVCKVSAYGMDSLRTKLKDEERGDYARFRDLFWVAPELLPASGSIKSASKKTQNGDIYSYAIILHEILTRDEPYSTGFMMATPKEIINKVKGNMIPPCRPEIALDKENEGCDPRYIKLMLRCWDDQSHIRPTFKEIRSCLKALNKGRNVNIVDNMIQMMEKYTDQLEDLVGERTKQLAEEKAKTDELLYKMLPRSIAEELKAGKAINAESFAGVTIFFSDIVGFTRIAAQSTPLQVVKFLNELYTCFDEVIDHHDVYKVETIGDAYMVVSGLPVRNGDNHAGEIATMALNLLSSVRDFTVSHLGSKVQIRIGIHTGSCVAGVVGLKMPRYCLFGDTVNYASRMESSGLALRIHVSPECKAVLDKLGGYYLEERGPVTMKGKGTVTTYFLAGKDGFDKPLPNLRDAARLEDHEFK